MEKGFFDKYYESSKKRKPSRLLLLAMKASPETIGNALEIGAGTAKDSIYLVENGFNVTAIDPSLTAEEFLPPDTQGIVFKQESMQEFQFENNSYDLISSIRALPYLSSKKDMEVVLKKITDALKPGGIFVANFFGPKDTWNGSTRGMTFVDQEDIESMITDLEVLSLSETESDEDTLNSKPHHWHIFDVIAKKPEST